MGVTGLLAGPMELLHTYDTYIHTPQKPSVRVSYLNLQLCIYSRSRLPIIRIHNWLPTGLSLYLPPYIGRIYSHKPGGRYSQVGRGF